MIRRISGLRILSITGFVLAGACARLGIGGAPSDVRAVARELLEADRGYAAASARRDVVAGISAMFGHDITMPTTDNRFAVGRGQAIQALRANPLNVRSRIEWTPVRVGVSADGQHGFTLGYMTLQMPDSAPVPMKYLAYWIRRAEGWRVVVYRRRRHTQPPTETEMMDAALPPRLVPATRNEAILRMHRESLDRAERQFSDSAQRVGLGRAFEIFGSADAVNLGDAAARDFIVGSEAIGRAIGAGSPASGSPVTWAPQRVIVASSGDLGVTIGFLQPKAPNGEAVPFFTVWRRATPADRWLYVAE